LIGSNQGNYFENATACSKRTLETTVATQLKGPFTRAVSTFLISILIGIFLLKMQHTGLHFYLGFTNLGLAKTACK
jgi:hypothetical protein